MILAEMKILHCYGDKARILTNFGFKIDFFNIYLVKSSSRTVNNWSLIGLSSILCSKRKCFKIDNKCKDID